MMFLQNVYLIYNRYGNRCQHICLWPPLKMIYIAIIIKSSFARYSFYYKIKFREILCFCLQSSIVIWWRIRAIINVHKDFFLINLIFTILCSYAQWCNLLKDKHQPFSGNSYFYYNHQMSFHLRLPTFNIWFDYSFMGHW